MFGTLRTILALMVAAGHLTDQWQIGTYAVFAFYIISGYLMTLIMHESYGFTGAGRVRFALNRFLRLYPMYWAVAIISALVIIWVGADVAGAYNKLMYLPTTLNEFLTIASMLYIELFPNKVGPNLAPTTWAITVELFFYVAICLGLSRNKTIVTVWLIASSLYLIYVEVAGLGWAYKYFPVMAASFPFSVGSMIYFLRKEGFPSLGSSLLWQPPVLALLLVRNAVAVLVFPIYFLAGFYISLLLSIVLCYQIVSGEGWGKLSASADKLIGDYSYPIYLLHWPIGLVMSYSLFGTAILNPTGQGVLVLACALVATFLVSHLLLVLIDRPIQKLRVAVKKSAY